MKKRLYVIILICATLTGLTFFSLLNPLDNSQNSFLSRENITNSSKTAPRKLFLSSWTIIKRRYYDSTLNKQDWERWKDRYVNQIQTEEDAYLAIDTMLASLDDPYSRFLGTEEYMEQNTNIDAQIVGIGVNITSLSGKIVVISAIEDTPAYSGGIKSGDIITKVDGVDVQGKDVSEIARLIRGEEGTNVALVLLRNGKKIEKIITRQKINIKSVKTKLFPKNIGYIQITSFLGMNVADDFLEAVSSLKNSKGIIIDLRGNTGGLLPNAVSIADMFLNNQNIVSIVDRNGIKKDIAAQPKDNPITKPVVILVDGATASASEILSGALKDYNKAILVGEKTYGKGMVQKIYPMPNQTGMNLTIAKYLTPNGYDLNKKGIEPDYRVQYTEKDYFSNNDPQLNEAKNIINRYVQN